MRVTATIERPRSEVFQAFCELDRAAERMSGIARVEVIAGDEFGVGARWRETRTMFGKEATEEMYVTAIDAPDSYVVEAVSGGTRYVSVLTFEEAGPSSTIVSMTFDATPTGLLSRLLTPMGWLLRGATKRMLQRDLDDMKRALEAS